MRISHLLFPHLLIGTGIWGTLLNHSHQPTGDQVGHIEALSDSSMYIPFPSLEQKECTQNPRGWQPSRQFK